MAIVTVGTFFEGNGKRPAKSRISAYTTWYSKGWPGCIQYAVMAKSVAQAKKLAIDQRLAREIALWEDRQPSREI